MKKYICGIAFQYEIGDASDVRVFDSLEDIKILNAGNSVE